MQYARLWAEDEDILTHGFTDVEREALFAESIAMPPLPSLEAGFLLLCVVNRAARAGWRVHTYAAQENQYLLERALVLSDLYMPNFILKEGDEIHWIYDGQAKSAPWTKAAHPQTADDPKWAYPLARIVRDGMTVWAAPE
jgi:hypothetical protein